MLSFHKAVTGNVGAMANSWPWKECASSLPSYEQKRKKEESKIILMQKEVVKISEQESFSAVLSVRKHWEWQKIWLLLKRRFNLSTQSTTLWALLLISTKTIVNAVLLTTNLNKLNITGSYGLSRKYGSPPWLPDCFGATLDQKAEDTKNSAFSAAEPSASAALLSQTALNIKQESSCFVSAMDPYFIASWRVN